MEGNGKRIRMPVRIATGSGLLVEIEVGGIRQRKPFVRSEDLFARLAKIGERGGVFYARASRNMGKTHLSGKE